MYFSRAPIPFDRDEWKVKSEELKLRSEELKEDLNYKLSTFNLQLLTGSSISAFTVTGAMCF